MSTSSASAATSLGVQATPHLGKHRLYNDMQTVSIWSIEPSNPALK